MAVGIRHAKYVIALYPQKLALISLTNGSRSVGIVRSRTQATEFFKVVKLFLKQHVFIRGLSCVSCKPAMTLPAELVKGAELRFTCKPISTRRF
jgi:hypothetical protein